MGSESLDREEETAFIEQIQADIEEINRRIKLRLPNFNFWKMEGSASIEELTYLYKLSKENNSQTVGEIGFNAGYSALAFLYANPNMKVTSFDIGMHPYVKIAKEYIDEKFPGRHTLIEGDSRETVPAFAQENPDTRFDTIFIDGGHSPKVAWADINNMKALAHKDTDVIMDDLIAWKPWGYGPYSAWFLAKFLGVVEEIELYQDGKKVDRVLPPAKRAWARARYVGLEYKE